MPIARVQLPDGRIARFEVPEGTTPEQVIAFAQSQQFDAPQETRQEPDLDARRSEVAKGITLRPFGIDTGIELPQWLTEGLAGAGHRLMEIGTLGFHETPDDVKELLRDSKAATVGGAAADLATLLGGGAALKGAGLLGKVAGAVTRPKTAVQGLLGGAGYGAATSNDRVEGAIGGAVGAGIGQAVGALGRAASPHISKAARTLLDKKVELTPGQILGGTAQRIEDTLTSVPVLGDMIKNAKVRSVTSFNRAAIDDALKIIGKQLPKGMPVGREAVEYADNLIGARYAAIDDNLQVQLDGPLVQDILNLRGMIRQLPEAQQGWISRQFDGEFAKAFNNPTRTALGGTYKTFMRDLRENYKRALKSNDVFQQESGKALREFHEAFKRAAMRQNPKWAPELQKTDAAWAAMSRVRAASAAKGAKDGVFAPHQLASEVRRAAQGNAYAHGRAFGQALSDAAQSVLPSTVPDSGSAGRAAWGLLASGAGAHMLYPPALPAVALGGAATGMYTPMGRKIAEALIASRPAGAEGLRTLLERTSPYAGLLGISAEMNR